MISLMQKIQEIEFLLSLQIQRNHVILNNGKIGFDQICNPKLMTFNLKNDTLVKIIYIPLDIATNRTGVGHLASDSQREQRLENTAGGVGPFQRF